MAGRESDDTYFIDGILGLVGMTRNGRKNGSGTGALILGSIFMVSCMGTVCYDTM